MVILGLGSNIEDRLSHLRNTLHLIKQIPNLTIEKISSVYISDALLRENAPASWNKPYFNLALRCSTSLSPYELLYHTKQIEKKMGRESGTEWGPRVIDIDLLAWDDWIQYDEALHIPHENLHERPFALWPLADVAPNWIYPLPGPWQGKTASELAAQWNSRWDGSAPLRTRQILQRIDTPQLVGILNITPDSFSDHYENLEKTFTHAKTLINEGATVLDIGAEATGPLAKPISADEEWQRLKPILEKIITELPNFLFKPKLSIDTRHIETAQKALELGVNWINDVTGLKNPALCEVIAARNCEAVFMHHLEIPENRNNYLPPHKNPLENILNWAKERITTLEKFFINPERLIFDVGIGYGKTAAHSLQLMQNISAFQQLGVRLLVGHSRKSFLTSFTDKPAKERDIETGVCSLFLAKQQVDFLRVHNVELHSRIFKMQAQFM